VEGQGKGNAGNGSVGVRVRSLDATVTVALTGELDDASVPAVESAVLRAAAEHDATRVRLDLAELSFIDSSGLAMLIRLERGSANEGFRFSVVEPSDAVRTRLDRTGLLTLLMDTHHLTDRTLRPS
jgi:anti-sigma B factor antagonist